MQYQHAKFSALGSRSLSPAGECKPVFEGVTGRLSAFPDPARRTCGMRGPLTVASHNVDLLYFQARPLVSEFLYRGPAQPRQFVPAKRP
ncbi:hypothetical protein E2C01_021709 [Portunus trituberculatus]|uniref:Uncharacterized protein n=1 Tax=Portunus trituberculatus TaxID=210409 RepID=A0A5B7E5F3_PORTR|nr:hypothetical protein [Portunus trituberculatus]